MQRVCSILYTLVLPAVLVMIFVIQNLLFNYWIGLNPNPYFISSMMASGALGLLLFMPAIVIAGYYRYIYLFITTFISSSILAAQYVYHSYFGGFFEVSVLRYVLQLKDQGGTLLGLLNMHVVVFFLGFGLVLVHLSMYRCTQTKHTCTYPESLALLCACIILALGGYGVARAQDDIHTSFLSRPISFFSDMGRFAYAPNMQVQKWGVVNFYAGDVIGSTLRSFTVTPEALATVQTWKDSTFLPARASNFGVLRGRNLIFIQVESLEGAVIGERVAGREITPHLNQLTREGMYFDTYYTQVGPGNTADAEFVTLNSLYPLSNTVAFIDYAHNTYNALPSLLTTYGYSTYVLHDDVPDFWNRSNIYPNLGYQTLISRKDYVSEGETILDGVGDQAFFRQSVEKMKTFSQPFMATLITLSSHTPFEIPTELQTLPIPSHEGGLTDTQRNYLISVHYADRAIGSFLDSLKEAGLYNNSLIVIYGDHGSFTGISGVLGGASSTMFSKLSANRVPLIILAPSTGMRGVYHTPGSHLDIYPTVANMLGLELSSRVFGQDLLNTRAPVEVYVDPDNQSIRFILTPRYMFVGADDGLFEHGRCYTMPQMSITVLGECEQLYGVHEHAVKASEIVVRGNLGSMLSLLQDADHIQKP